MVLRAVLFDLDGTLLDTLDDIASAGNVALSGEGFPTHPTAAYRRFIGEGLEVLCRRAAPATVQDAGTLTRLATAYRAAYARTWNDQTRPYQGIPAMLDGLAERRVALGVLSNKPEEFTRLCVEEYLGRWRFVAVLGAREDRPRKPDPAGALQAAEKLGLPPDAILYVGDTATDMETAKAAGMTAVGVSWGFRPAEELHQAGATAVIDKPLELLEILDNPTRRSR